MTLRARLLLMVVLALGVFASHRTCSGG